MNNSDGQNRRKKNKNKPNDTISKQVNSQQPPKKSNPETAHIASTEKALPKKNRNRNRNRNRNKNKKSDNEIKSTDSQLQKQKGKKVKTKNEKIMLTESFKLIVRKLPPLLSEKCFWDKVSVTYPELNGLVKNSYYVTGKYPANPYFPPTHSKCFIQGISEGAIMEIGNSLKNLTFKDDLNQTGFNTTETVDELDDDTKLYTPSIEKAIYSMFPNETSIKTNEMNGKIKESPVFQLFADFCNGTGKFSPVENAKGDKKTTTKPHAPDSFFDLYKKIETSKKKKRKKESIKQANIEAGTLKTPEKAKLKTPPTAEKADKKNTKPKKKLKSAKSSNKKGKTELNKPSDTNSPKIKIKLKSKA
ncbi:hypothetical protein DAMA08_005500 [Martiniozyma asiatica (nom. inval.)]|nr:hypothetical protein DAMA08_005500 [Martiniozyma asiatica]